ncbi:MAG: hypothetical protein GX444_10700 [Myxococcales bacterium]|nr:hypothetical protein [Myxococcales bacterium]
MARRFRSWLLLLAPTLCLWAAAAGAAPKAGLTWSGFFESINRATIEGPSEFNYNENVLGLEVTAIPTGMAMVYGSLHLVNIGIDERVDDHTLTIDQQQDRSQTDPVRLELDEAYLQVSGLGVKDLDLKIGKQRIQWGTGDQFNPTDNLNPDDLHDPLRFGAKVPTPALQAQYFLGQSTFTAVLVPLFEPALLPRTDVRPIFEKQFAEMSSSFQIDTGDAVLDSLFDSMIGPALDGASLGSVNIHGTLPDKTPRNMNYGLKFASNFGPIDFSISYAYVRDDFGVPKRITMTVAPLSGDSGKLIDTVDVDVENAFPREHVIGGDYSANVPALDIGVWGEVAFFIPESMETTYVLDAGTEFNRLFGGIARRDLENGVVIAKDKPLEDNFFKAVAGLDYTFPGAIYINTQYVHGFPNESTAEAISDYQFLMIDRPFLNDAIKPRLNALYCYTDQSFVIYPEVYFFPYDAIEISLGTFHIFGEIDTSFGQFGHDFAFLRAKATF